MPVYDLGMDTLQQLSDAARRLTPADLRKRLDAIDQEARIIRALLRASTRGAITLSQQAGQPPAGEAHP